MSFHARREFLGRVGAGLTSAFLLPSYGIGTEIPQAPERSLQALRLRIEAAKAQHSSPISIQTTNGDSERYPSYLANYSKGLNHDDSGLVDLTAYGQLLQALQSGQWSDFEAISLGGSAKLANPMAAFAYCLEGCDSHHTFLPAPPDFASDEQASELVELYWHSLTRDVPYSEYSSNTLIQQASADITKFGPTAVPRVNGAVTGDTVFRASLPGCLVGSYVSQFLWLNVPIDNLVLTQAYPRLETGTDRITQYADWLQIQNGFVPGPSAPLASARYILTARDLASYAHRDISCQSALNASLILNSFGPAALSDANPYKHSKTQSSFISFGLPGLLDWVVRAANAALRASWYQKWLVHRRLRPEEFGGRVQRKIVSKASFPISEVLFRSNVLNKVHGAQGSYLLSQAYDEGCPIHPSYPAGHATIAGACITILKALFEESFVIPQPLVPSTDGSKLLLYSGESLTIGGELNKLAANISFGRDAAGIHWRSDSLAGLQLGEQVATALLNDLSFVASDCFAAFAFQGFDGSSIRIANG